MTREKTPPRELSPLELWDQLAVQQVKHQLAPHGFKKVYNGKSEVSNIQFLGKQTVNTVCVISANLIRLYRENLRERMNEIIKHRNNMALLDESKLKACRFWEFKKKRVIRDGIGAWRMGSFLAAEILEEIDTLKPSTPKTKEQPKMKVVK